MAEIFSYTARNEAGRFVAGSLRAETRGHALTHLRSRSLFVTSLEEQQGFGGIIAAALAVFPISAAERNLFVRSLATLLGAGVPMRRALQIVSSGSRSGRLREAINAVASDVDSGVPLSVAMERRPREFSRLFVAMIRAGELSGSVDVVLGRIATFMEHDAATKKSLKSALAYPAVVTAAAIGLVVFLISNTIPAFAQLFTQMHVSLPGSTRMLIAAGAALASPWSYLVIAGALAALTCMVLLVSKSDAGSRLFDRAIFSVPFIGTIVRKGVLARFARTFGTLLRSGVPMLSALDASREVVANASYSRHAEQVSEMLREGAPVSDALGHVMRGDELMLALVRVGDETGSLDEMLLKIAEHYETDVATMIKSLSGMLEPIIIVVLGAIVGTIVGSILIPLYSMIGSIK